MNIGIVIADDHAVVRDGLRLLLESQDMKVIGEAENGRDAVRLISEMQPDIAIIDIAMPELNGIEASRQIKENSPATQVIILSMHSTSEHIFRALDAGIRGYILKESAGAEVINAVRAVRNGRMYLSEKIREKILDLLPQLENKGRLNPMERLSDREREILQLVAEGKSNSEMANILHLSRKTVETYRSRLIHKLGITDVPSLVKFAIKQGLISLDE